MEPRRISRHSAVAGTIIWIVWQLLSSNFAPLVLFVLSPLVLVPLLLAAVVDAHEESPLWRALCWAQLPCALLLPLGLSLDPGAFALLACLPWAGWTVVAAVEGLRRMWGMLREGGLRGLYDTELAIAAGLSFPVIGSGWLLCDRLAIEPLGFSPLIVLLTAVHFHHAGFTLPISAGLLGRAMPQREPWRAAAVGVVFAVPLVAVGITVSPLIEVVGSLLTVTAAVTVGVGMLRRSTSLPPTPLLPALLSALAGACLLAAMMFAGSYAIGEYTGTPWPDIGSMIQLHGAVNALGFGLLGAWAWHLSPPASPRKIATNE
ncbi:membrane protein [Enhygromyxa salina]|uniref:Membrane protein n=1 Tax=Enhygromyxa salina TaxID=215803 RepID=A0A0C1Z7T2_9BACT|nr:YndJ family transporter [Enhygromyxa salina]KIG13689.1 membrane protein [Enhygromyxa salina]